MSSIEQQTVKVSIITATFNSESTILETYRSLSTQSYDNWEWLVTDDCSTDKTLSILKTLARDDSRIQVFKNEVNSGAAVSRNKSLSHVSGDYIAFIDSDDLWCDIKLENQLSYMLMKDLDFTFTAYNLIDEEGRDRGKLVDKDNVPHVDYKDMLKKKATMGCSTVMVKAASFRGIEMPLLRTGQDYATWLVYLKRVDRAYLLNEVLTSYRIVPGSISRNKYKKAKRQWEIYRIQESLGFVESCYCFVFYAYRAVFRR
ncbi:MULTISPECIES: glycosyltransferase family 2 protein [Vibrio harveyi group]|uniref:Putative teichuronic acid biosynthesis glycosyltransferase TuaG n=1 Tax=Vibrio parahaemolyticus TaxID=670 RepID=A0A7M3VHV5_VIBPH|nr:glycosyltransferase family 2 protein [Vibrio diabolicus]EIU6821636.1 glycosyltransferase family 2 protein [Vibrio parahaemolyticus]MCR9497711.1 glycosyltransferase family 2 protein [Vibrio alginolyticus]MCS0417673.1 glycosyltransferase family 2 protein [Vibrio diabolicus]QOS14850.1 putative teichuronic acid biosynthesis glycosyltransferase TuaG [Vibrio parahaemolyticus]HCE4752861.1 glycosyltransferase family 2 protein [Vibrio parahaemolyticus]